MIQQPHNVAGQGQSELLRQRKLVKELFVQCKILSVLIVRSEEQFGLDALMKICAVLDNQQTLYKMFLIRYS